MEAQTPPNSDLTDPNGSPVSNEGLSGPDPEAVTAETSQSEPTAEAQTDQPTQAGMPEESADQNTGQSLAPGLPGPTIEAPAVGPTAEESLVPNLSQYIVGDPRLGAQTEKPDKGDSDPTIKRVSLKVPGALYPEIEADAIAAGANVHAFIIQTLRNQRVARLAIAERDKLRLQYQNTYDQLLEANSALNGLQRSYQTLVDNQDQDPAPATAAIIPDGQTEGENDPEDIETLEQRIADYKTVVGGLQTQITTLTELLEEESKRADDAISTLYDQRSLNETLSLALEKARQQPASPQAIQDRDNAWFKIVDDLCVMAAKEDHLPKAAYKRYFTAAKNAYTNQFGI